MYLYPLRGDARARLRAPEPCPTWQQHPRVAPADVPLLSLLQELERIPDHRRGQGRKFRLAVLLAIWQLARLSGYHGVGHLALRLSSHSG